MRAASVAALAASRADEAAGDGEPMPGLYAAGEIVGLYYGNYTGATSVLKGMVFGRIAGRLIATDVVDVRPDATVSGQVLSRRFILDPGASFEGRVEPQDLTATIYHCLGHTPDTELHDRFGRPLTISKGRPIEAILS